MDSLLLGRHAIGNDGFRCQTEPRWVCQSQGFSQRDGVDYYETFSLVVEKVEHSSKRMLIARLQSVRWS
jgi:hypothetical protein